jgi:biopolymer transport protein ExbD
MRWRTDTPELTPSMPVAPMLDMAFQVLAFFILIYHPASSERAVPLHTPESTVETAQPKSTAKPVIKIDIVIDPGAQHAVVYSLRAEDRRNRTPCDLQTLRDRLKTSQPGTAVRISAQAGIPMSDVVAAVDAAAAAGQTSITFGEPAAPLALRR